MSAKHVLAVGWYGAGNLGDELLLDTLKRWTEEVGAELTAISIDPWYTESVHGIAAVDFFDLKAIARAMTRSDLFVMGGGGLFQTYNSFTVPALYEFAAADIAGYARPALLAAQMGVPTLVWAQGVGPLATPEARAVVRDIFEHASAVTVRDESSAELLRDCGVHRTLDVAPDPVWSWPIDARAKAAPGGTRRIAVALREWSKAADWEERLLEAITSQIPPEGTTLVWLHSQGHAVPGRSVSDSEFIESLMARLPESYRQEQIHPRTPLEFVGALADCDVVIAMRLHVQILALRMGKPTLCIEYDDKMEAVSLQASLPDDSRIKVDARAEAWIETLREWWAASSSPSVPLPIGALEARALLHRDVLHQAIASSRNAGDGWTRKTFDWLGAWHSTQVDAGMRERDRMLLRANELLSEANGRCTQLIAEAVKQRELVEIERASHVQENKKLTAEIAELGGTAEKLERDLAEAQAERLRLELAVNERDERLRAADHDRAELRENLAQAHVVATSRELELQRNVTGLEAELAHAGVREQELRAEVHALRTSTSWRITRPLRFARYFLRSPAFAVSEAAKLLGARKAEQPQPLYHSVAVSKPAAVARRAAPYRTVYIFTGVPYDDIGGGQRAAQLARVLLGRGERVVYLYAYRKWHNGVEVRSEIDVFGMEHHFLDDVDLAELVSRATAKDIAIFELPHPKFKAALDACNKHRMHTVFELIDAWDSSLGGDWFSEEVLDQFIRDALIVVGTAKKLQSILRERGRPDALYLPNAANESIFDRYATYARPGDLDVGKRVVLYFGSLYGEWFDWDAVNTTAESLTDAVVYLIGDPPVDKDISPRVRMLGARPIDELPAYLRYTDIAILPFIPGHISDAVSPIKVFEYLFMGVPVASLDLPEVRGYPNVHIASDAAEFARLCERHYDVQNVDDFIVRNSWSARLDQMIPARWGDGSITAVVLIHNNESIIRRCLDSLILHGARHLRKIIVVDNASEDRGPEIVRAEYPEVELVSNPVNGCSSGRNLGARLAEGDVLAFFDSDQWLTGRGCFEEALEVLRERPDIGAVGWAAGWFDPDHHAFGGPIMDYLPGRGTQVEEYRLNGVRTDVAYLGSGGLFVRREVFDRVGGFDEFYDPTCFEDTDFSLKIKAGGWALAYRNLQGIRHQAHQTTGASDANDRYQLLFRRNAKYFGDKWKECPEFFFDVSSAG